MARIKNSNRALAAGFFWIGMLAQPSLGYAQEAPEQTVESAQLFLGKVAGQGHMQMSVYSFGFDCPGGGGYNIVCTVDNGDFHFPPSPIVSARPKPSNACVTELEARVVQLKGTPPFELYDNPTVVYREADGMFRFHWPYITRVSRTGTNVYIVSSGGRFKITISEEALAARVEYAMEFLRLNCDATAGTGF